MLKDIVPESLRRWFSPRTSQKSDPELVRESFARIVDRSPDVVHRFYDILFARYPDAVSLFRKERRAEQEKMLTETLVAAVESLENPAWLETNLTALGAKHRGYGVTDQMYDWVGTSLLATLAEVAGPDWSPEIERAWTNTYTAMANLMKKGAQAS